MSIKRLPDEVINKIAAGEIIVRPSNVVKELVENSIDARAANISVIIGNGGLQSIQVLDDGVGIAYSDHALACVRFATSKLNSADELLDGRVSSFGFRGEALASMSLVSHVTITSKNLSDMKETGFESRYTDGSIVSGYPSASPFCGDSGTRIIIDDLFFNNPARKKAFKSTSSEYKRILDLIAKFAISFPFVNFRVRKAGSPMCDLIEEHSSDERLGRIESLTGYRKSDLVTIKITHEDNIAPDPLQQLECVCLNPNSLSSKALTSTTAILVVNDRLVETSNSSLIKNIENEVCTLFQCNKAGFLFVSLSLDRRQVDVNVCPTKGKVVYANQAQIEEFIVGQVVSQLLEKRKVKMIKLNKIEFSSMNIASQRPPEPQGLSLLMSQDSQPFKVRTCPKQNFFATPPARRPEASQSFIELSLTQVDVVPQTTQDVDPPLAIANGDPDEFEMIVNSLAISMTPTLEQNPRDFVLVGVVERYVLCQYFTRLCVCNIHSLAKSLVKSFLLNNQFSLMTLLFTSDSDLSDFPEYLRTVLGNGRCPSVRGGPSRIGAFQVKKLIASIRSNLEGLDDLNESSTSLLADLVVEWILETEYDSNYRLIWDEIIRNKNFLNFANISDEKSPPDLIGSGRHRNWFFRELISLKELYKEFERC